MLLGGLIGAVVGGALGGAIGAIPGFRALKRAKEANELATEANRIAADALREARLAAQRPRQYLLLDEAREVLNSLLPRFDVVPAYLVAGMKLADDALPEYIKTCDANAIEIDVTAATLAGIANKSNDQKLVDLLRLILPQLGTISGAMRECSMHACGLLDLAKKNASKANDRHTALQLLEAARRSVEPCQAAERAAQDAVVRLDELDRDGPA